MPKPCNHEPGKRTCRICWLYDHDPRYRTLWGGGPLPANPPAAPDPGALRAAKPRVSIAGLAAQRRS